MVKYIVFEVRTGFFHVILDERDQSLVAMTSQFADEGQKCTETDVLSQVLCYVSLYQTLHPLSCDCVGGRVLCKPSLANIIPHNRVPDATCFI
jgi:hypothetical protein